MFSMKRTSVILLLALAASGCALTADGIGSAHHAPDANKVSQMKAQLQENAASSAAATHASGDATTTDAQPGILVIGTTGPLRTVEDKDRGGFYSAYIKAAGQWHPAEPPTLDEAAFQAKLGGWASVQTFGIPGVGGVRLRMLVPTNVVHEAQFASVAGSFLFGTTDDLVVARSDHDGLLWLERVLCRGDGSYHACAKSYKAGVFDLNTGQELARDRKPKVNGSTVSITTYMKISQP
jgi:hypothetical protein